MNVNLSSNNPLHYGTHNDRNETNLQQSNANDIDESVFDTSQFLGASPDILATKGRNNKMNTMQSHAKHNSILATQNDDEEESKDQDIMDKP